MSKILHKSPRSETSLSDEWGTPKELFIEICMMYNIRPKLDVAASDSYHLCEYYFTKEDNALVKEWLIKADTKKTGVWCNPPHSLTEEFVRKAHEQWKKHNINIVMIIPANSMCTKYAEECIEGSAEYHPIFSRPRFIFGGRPSKYNARNGYFSVCWRKR